MKEEERSSQETGDYLFEADASKKPEHYFTEKPKSKKRYGLILAGINGIQYEFLTCSGIFSSKAIDKGTFLLAESMQIPSEADVLDLGCGYGVLGIVAAGLTKGKVLFTDINYRAIELAKKNLKKNNIKNSEARKSAFFEDIPEKFDAILLNPPFTAGMDVVMRLIEESKQPQYTMLESFRRDLAEVCKHARALLR